MNQFVHPVVFFDLGMTLVGKDTTKWVPGAKALLQQLGAANLRLGVISNTGNLSRAELQSRLPADFDWDIFDPTLILLSSEVGVEKPSLDIFRLAISRAGVSAAQCLYCSEDLLETLAAQHVGMSAARIVPPPRGDLRKLEQALRDLAQLH
jgi:FMN phosphatase YigB (HAD superfamily)